jgi:hypothetical protein
MLHRWPSSFVLQVGGCGVQCVELPWAANWLLCLFHDTSEERSFEDLPLPFQNESVFFIR